MGSSSLGYTPCEDCHGGGKKSDGTRCPNCHGSGLVAVPAPPHQENGEKKWTGKRRFTRYLTNLLILVSIPERDMEGCCTHISEGGLGVLLREPVPVGTGVVLHFTVPDHPSELLRLQAVVRYQIGFQHGVEFVSLNEAERRVIRQFCSQLPSVGG